VAFFRKPSRKKSEKAEYYYVVMMKMLTSIIMRLSRRLGRKLLPLQAELEVTWHQVFQRTGPLLLKDVVDMNRT
jgi:hypothetical protein